MKRIIVTDVTTETYTVLVPDEAYPDGVQDLLDSGASEREGFLDRSVHEVEWEEWTSAHAERWGEPKLGRTLFPVADLPNMEEADRLGCNWPPNSRELRVATTGEFRPPIAGEWYLSGAIIEGYRAPSDLHTPFHIARLVRIRQVNREVVVARI